MCAELFSPKTPRGIDLFHINEIKEHYVTCED